MPAVLKNLRRKRERVAQETLERLDADSTKGPEAKARFVNAAKLIFRQVPDVPKK